MLKVSIITPTWNMGHYLDQCIESIKQQSWPSWEHIIIDNCSTDETVHVVEPYLKDPRYIFLREADRGQAEAINKGLNIASGDIVCWLNADDFYFDKEVLFKVVDTFNSDPTIDVLTGKGFYTDSNGQITKPISLPKSIFKLKYYDPILQPATFWRKNNFLLDANWHYIFDWVLFLQLFQSGFRFKLIDEYLACYRVDGNNKTALDNSSRRKEIMQLQKINLGELAINTIWCKLLYHGYYIAELLNWRWLKLIFKAINWVLFNISRGYICST